MFVCVRGGCIPTLLSKQFYQRLIFKAEVNKFEFRVLGLIQPEKA